MEITMLHLNIVLLYCIILIALLDLNTQLTKCKSFIKTSFFNAICINKTEVIYIASQININDGARLAFLLFSHSLKEAANINK